MTRVNNHQRPTSAVAINSQLRTLTQVLSPTLQHVSVPYLIKTLVWCRFYHLLLLLGNSLNGPNARPHVAAAISTEISRAALFLEKRSYMSATTCLRL